MSWPKQEEGAAPSVAAAPPASRPVAAAADEQTARNAALDALCLEFADHDRELLAGMLDDQGGDAREVTLMLRRMRRQAQRSQGGQSGATESGAKRKRG